MSTSKKPAKKTVNHKATASHRVIVSPKATASPKDGTKGKPRSGATTASILGHVLSKKDKNAPVVGNRNIRVKPEWVKYYENLIDLRERLLHQMTGLVEGPL